MSLTSYRAAPPRGKVVYREEREGGWLRAFDALADGQGRSTGTQVCALGADVSRGPVVGQERIGLAVTYSPTS